jgi:predicted transcriptional regulator
MAKGIEYKLIKLLKGNEMLVEEISEKLKIPEKKLEGYLDKMESAGKLKASITEEAPWEKIYRV